MAAGEEQLQFETLLKNLLSPVNETRAQAEVIFIGLLASRGGN
jgi:hypothetical protein